MFESKSRFVKIGGYIIIGFFSIIIIISFGMPNFMSKLGMDDNVVAVVNGERIYRLDFLRYRDRLAERVENINKKEVQESILDSMIMRRLMLQKADDIGIEVSRSRVTRSIKEISAFKDEKGRFNKELMERVLTHYHQGLEDFYLLVKEDIILNELRGLIFLGTGVAPDEVKTEYTADNSQLRIRYCYVTASDIDKRFKDKITITDKEVDEELLSSKEELKDPVTDRKRIREKLINRKLNEFRNELIEKVDRLALEKRPFNEAASVLRGKIFMSDDFKLGEPVKSRDKGTILHSVYNSDVFKDSLLSLKPGVTSRVISSFDGLYVFTPVKKRISLEEPSPEEYKKIESEILYQKNNSLYMSMLSSIRDESEIIKNLKF